MLQLRHDNTGQIRAHSLSGHVLIQVFKSYVSCLSWWVSTRLMLSSSATSAISTLML